MLLLTGARCVSSADDAARAAGNGAKPHPVPELPHIPPAAGEGAIPRTQSLVNKYFAGYDAEDAEQGVRYACLAVNAYEAGQARTMEEAVAKLVGGQWSNFASSVHGLAEELRQAKSAGDAATRLTWFGMCEFAG
jgi:hypothetical protein